MDAVRLVFIFRLFSFSQFCIVNSIFHFSEACIYAIYSIAEHIETDERTGLPKFIVILSEIPYDKLHEKLLGTALDSIGNILSIVFLKFKQNQFLNRD